MVCTKKEPCDAPPPTVTEAGTVAAPGLLFISVTTRPPLRAGFVSVTVPVNVVPPVTVAGFRLTDVKVGVPGEPNVRSALMVLPEPSIAETKTVVVAATENVVTGKVTLVLPAGTMIVGATRATDALAVVRLSGKPPGAARPFSVTVPVDGVPPMRLAGLRVTELSEGGMTVRNVVTVVPTGAVAEIVANAGAATGLVVTVNEAPEEPAATKTLAGTLAIPGLVLARAMLTPPMGAALFKTSVHVAGLPPVTEVKVKERD